MIAVDTNILVYAHRRDSQFHAEAFTAVSGLAADPSAWAIPWPCLHEFLAIVTHRRIYLPPSSLPQALDQIDAWIEAPNLVLLSESVSHWTELREFLVSGAIVGPQVHDARIAALCRQHGVRELWSADRDFSRLAGLTVANPLVL